MYFKRLRCDATQTREVEYRNFRELLTVISDRNFREKRLGLPKVPVTCHREDLRGAQELMMTVYYYICWRLKLEGETENMGVCAK